MPDADTPILTATSVGPAPTVEEAAAIAAAIEAWWPRPTTAEPPEQTPTTAWRFSGRWWRHDRLARAERPWS